MVGGKGERMTIAEIISGLKFTVEMFLFDPSTGEKLTEPRNNMDIITLDACKGAIKALEQTRWIPCTERLPKEDGCYLVTIKWKGRYSGDVYTETTMAEYKEKTKEWDYVDVIAWMPLPEPYKAESEDK